MAEAGVGAVQTGADRELWVAQRRAQRLSVFDGLFYAVMLGVCESYLGTLAVELGHGPTAMALLVTLPLLVGAVLQLGSGALASALGGRKRLVVLGAATQALCCLAFAFIAYRNERSLSVLLGAKLVFWAANLIIAPSWSDWMASVVPEPQRGRYFGFRSAAVHVVLLVAFGLASFLLQSAAPAELFTRYQWLFVVAAIARALSAGCLAWQPDPTRVALATGSAARRRLRVALREGHWQVAIYLAVLMFGAGVSIPFFTPYMLDDLQLTYSAFAGLTAASILTKAGGFVVSPLVTRRFGQRRMLAGAGALIAAVPAAWAIAAGRSELLAAQLLSGVAWAGLEYASFQLLLTSAPVGARTEFLSLAGAASGLAQLCGALLGSQLLAVFSLAYTEVFWVSALLRGAALVVLVLGLRHLQIPARAFRFAMRVVSVRPAGGTLARPVAPTLPPPVAESDE